MADTPASLHQNRCSFVFQQPRKGRRGGFFTACRLNKAAFIEVRTPEYVDGMTFEEARTAWVAYLARLNRLSR